MHAGIGNLLGVILFPILMYTFRLGATGAALSTVVSQYVFFLWLYVYLHYFFFVLFGFHLIYDHAQLFMFKIRRHLFNAMVSKQESNTTAPKDWIIAIWGIHEIW